MKKYIFSRFCLQSFRSILIFSLLLIPILFNANSALAADVQARIAGDINLDKKVDISDVILVLRMALGLDMPKICSDINGDKAVNISDVILTLRMALELDTLRACN